MSTADGHPLKDFGIGTLRELIGLLRSCIPEKSYAP